MFKQFKPKARYYDHVLNMYLKTEVVTGFGSISSSKRLKTITAYPTPDIILKWKPSHIPFTEFEGRGAYRWVPLDTILFEILPEESTNYELLNQYDISVVVTITNADNVTVTIQPNLPDETYSALGLGIGFYLVKFTYTITIPGSNETITNVYEIVYEVIKREYGLITNTDNVLEPKVYIEPDTPTSDDRFKSDDQLRSSDTDTLPAGFFNDPDANFEAIKPSNILPKLLGNGGDIDVNPWGESAYGVFTNDPDVAAVVVRINYDDDWEDVRFLSKQIPRFWKRDANGNESEFGDGTLSKEDLFFNDLSITSDENKKYIYLNGGLYPLNLQRRNRGVVYIRLIFFSSATEYLKSTFLAMRNYALELEDDANNIVQDWWTAGLDVEGWREDLDDTVIDARDAYESAIDILGFAGTIDIPDVTGELKPAFAGARGAVLEVGTKIQDTNDPNFVDGLTDIFEFFGYTIKTEGEGIETSVRSLIYPPPGPASGRAVPLPASREGEGGFSHRLRIPYKMPDTATEGYELRFTINAVAYPKHAPTKPGMESTLFVTVRYDPSLDPTTEDPTFTIIPEGIGTFDLTAVTPGGIYVINGTPFPEGSGPYTFIPGINTITYTTPDGSTSTQTTQYLPPAPIPVSVNSAILLSTRTTPNININAFMSALQMFASTNPLTSQFRLRKGTEPLIVKTKAKLNEETNTRLSITTNSTGNAVIENETLNYSSITLGAQWSEDVTIDFRLPNNTEVNITSCTVNVDGPFNGFFRTAKQCVTSGVSPTDANHWDGDSYRNINAASANTATFTLPSNKTRYIMFHQGGQTLNQTTPIYSNYAGTPWWDVQDITQFVTNGSVTIGPRQGSQGFCHGFYCY